MSKDIEALIERAAPTVKTTYHCAGCTALQTEDWSFVEENDGLDTGTDAKCLAAGPPRHITSYWHTGDKAPDWCPALLRSLNQEESRSEESKNG